MKNKFILLFLLVSIINLCKAQNQFAFNFAGGPAGAVNHEYLQPVYVGFYNNQKICRDAAGNFYVADYRNHKVKKVTREGVVSNVAGSGAIGSIDGPAATASFRLPSGICIDATGNIYVVDPPNNNIRKISPAGIVSTFAGSTACIPGTGDGIGTAAKFYCPEDICIDPTTGNFYVADGCSNRIRKITPAGVVTTLTGTTGGFADGTLASAKFSYPCSVDCDASGNVYVCDLMNRKIRMISPAGMVSTVAGSGAAAGNDGAANVASFNYPYDVCWDVSGNLYVADGYNHKIRKISPAGIVTTISGSGVGGSSNGYGSSAGYSYPSGICTDAIGNIYVSVYAGNYIKKICLPCTSALPYDYVVPTGGTTTSDLFGGATTIVNKNIYVIEPLVIDNNITFSGCNIVVASSLSLPITSTGDLTLNNQTRILACNNMWNGITVPTGRSLTISGDVMIEDALTAISPAAGAIVSIDNAIFNRNLTAIELPANTSTSSPISVTGSVFTSRDIPLNANVTLNPTASSLATNITSATPYAAMVLKAPYNNRKGCYGIKATDIANLTIGAALAGKTNYFDAIMSGIHLTRCNALIYNNKFQNLLGYGGLMACLIGTPCYYESGYGIIASGNTTGGYGITIGGTGAYQSNTFYNTYGAISVSDYLTTNITGNSIDNSTTGPFSTAVTNYGSMGISVRPTANQLVNINNNSLIKNCATGITVNRSNTACTSTQGILISNNTITANATGYCATGIKLQDVIGSTNAPPIGKSIRISNNTITEAQNCITAISVKNGLTISGNSGMGIAYHATALRYGVCVQNCENVVVYQNTNIHCTTPNAYTNAGANIRGIYYLNTRVAQVQCNELNNVSQALMFEGNCSGILQPTLVRGNTINSCYHGLYMKNNAEINVQGNTMLPSDNLYYGPFASGYQTFTNNANTVNTNSIFYVRSNNGGLPTIPTQHGGTNPYVNGTGIVTMVATNYPGWCNVNTRLANENDEDLINSELTAEINMDNSSGITTSLYPNPNNGKMVLDYVLPEGEKGTLIIKDVTGKTIRTYDFNSSSNQLSISEEELNDGIYFYEITVSNLYIKRDKLIVVK